ncbi:MAG: hypothetical protein WA639_04385 [Candidatus Acidiferrum sp.]
MAGLKMFATAVITVFAVAGLFGWMMFRAGQSADRAARDPRYRRRQMILVAAVYSVFLAYGIMQIAFGRLPRLDLVGLIIPILFIWYFWRAASRTKIPRE